uniref:Uncharacterized protein LOC100181768 n=1 Tax=Phallusia mammillata TaxID=59560 RepID=A0A6F9DHQ5_9ASCI|nr:uncharacterized protein LOC100181768 [Phallusia mammillata]
MRFFDFFGSDFNRGHNDNDWNRDSAENEDFFAGGSFETGFPNEQNGDDWVNLDENHHGSLYRFGVDGFHDDLFSIMDQFMKGFHFGPNQMPPLQPGIPMQRQHEKSLRDQVLKQPYSNPPALDKIPQNPRQSVQPPVNYFDSMMKDFFGQSFFAPFLNDMVPKEDKDLDKDVVDHGLEAVLDQQEKPHTSSQHSAITPHTFFHGTMESRSKIMRSDGSSEERITKRDSQGNEETTIIYSSPDGQRRTVVEKGDGSDYTENSSRSIDMPHGVLKEPNNPYQSPPQGFKLFTKLNKIYEDLFSK